MSRKKNLSLDFHESDELLIPSPRAGSKPRTPRVRTTGGGKGEICLEIYVQEVNVPTKTADIKQCYLQASMQLFSLLENKDFPPNCNLTTYLEDKYKGKVVMEVQGTTLQVHMNVSPEKLLGVQCDHSSGNLEEILQRLVVTPEVLDILHIDGLRVGVNLNNTQI